MEIIKLNQVDEKKLIAKICTVLKSGGLVILPTETVYGVMADATNQVAVNKVLTYKKRRPGQPISIAVNNQNLAEKYVELNNQAKQLYQTLLPGPVTVISQSLHQLPSGLESEFGGLGIRIPDYSFLLKLIKTYGQPLTATSANSRGKKNPYHINDILNNTSIKQQSLIDLIIDANQLPTRPPSLVIDTTLSTPLVIREQQNTTQSIDIATQRNTLSFKSYTPSETATLAKKLIFKHLSKLTNQPLVIALNGELGVGKTIFTKAIADFLAIEDIITSPTYTYLKEYPFSKQDYTGKLFHLDLWTVDDQTTFDHLDLPALMQPGHLIIIEWWNQVEKFASFQPNLIINLEAPNTPTSEIDPNQDSLRNITIYEK